MLKKIVSSYKVFGDKKYKMFFLLYFSFFLTNGALEDSFPLLISYLGFSESDYGVFLSIVAFTSVFAPMTISLASRKFGYYTMGITGVLLGFSGALLIGIGNFQSLTFFLFAYFLFLSRLIFNFSIGNKINSNINEDNRSKFFSLRDLFLYGSISIGLIAGGFVVNQFTFSALYTFFSFLALMPCVVILQMKRKKVLEDTTGGALDGCAENTKDSLSDEDSSNNKKKKQGQTKLLFKQKAFWGFILINLFSSFYLISVRFVPILGLSLGIDVSNFMTIIGIMTLINAVGGVILGYFFEKGRKLVFVADMVINLIPAILFAFTQSVVIFMIAYTITTLKGMLSPISFAYFFDCFSEDDAPIALGLISSIESATDMITPIIIGVLWVTSHRLVFAIGAIGIVTACIVAWVLLPSKSVVSE